MSETRYPPLGGSPSLPLTFVDLSDLLGSRALAVVAESDRPAIEGRLTEARARQAEALESRTILSELRELLEAKPGEALSSAAKRAIADLAASQERAAKLSKRCDLLAQNEVEIFKLIGGMPGESLPDAARRIPQAYRAQLAHSRESYTAKSDECEELRSKLAAWEDLATSLPAILQASGGETILEAAKRTREQLADLRAELDQWESFARGHLPQIVQAAIPDTVRSPEWHGSLRELLRSEIRALKANICRTRALLEDGASEAIELLSHVTTPCDLVTMAREIKGFGDFRGVVALCKALGVEESPGLYAESLILAAHLMIKKAGDAGGSLLLSSGEVGILLEAIGSGLSEIDRGSDAWRAFSSKVAEGIRGRERRGRHPFDRDKAGAELFAESGAEDEAALAEVFGFEPRTKSKAPEWERPSPVLLQSHGPQLKPATPGSAGLDLPLEISKAITLAGFDRVTLDTGVRVAIPPGFEGQIRPRSSASLRGLHVALGTIDSDYRGPIKITVMNLSKGPQVIEPNTSIAQLVICPAPRMEIKRAKELPPTERGSGGFGSTDEKSAALRVALAAVTAIRAASKGQAPQAEQIRAAEKALKREGFEGYQVRIFESGDQERIDVMKIPPVVGLDEDRSSPAGD